MKLIVIIAIALLMAVESPAQSFITDAEGHACITKERGRLDVEADARLNAEKAAKENVLKHIRTDIFVREEAAQDMLVDAHSKSVVKILRILDSAWYRDTSGDCFGVMVKAELAVPEENLKKIYSMPGVADVLTAPLKFEVWPSQTEYKKGERMKFFMKSNKPFYARVLYRDAGGSTIQLLPNIYRRDAYFEGHTTHEIPGAEDKIELKVSAPFGAERVTVHASTLPLGELDLIGEGNLWQVKTDFADAVEKSKAINMIPRDVDDRLPMAGEFIQRDISITTRQN